ncbi:DUF1016 N-terminal domain-containing protein [Burkholderia stabilis]|uniref:DUF1016 N-terminal domain-containing protein n=1 Tax=Burkholderia stabilis TaxID=95485 RepID=UPI0009F69CFB|nr:DUF1016 N-terminal domain-containing protein [Burkholderia stabilis]
MLGGERAGDGQQILPALARQLRGEYGPGWSEQQLRHCIRAAEVFPGEQILSTLRRESSWTQLKMPIYVEDPLKRDCYFERCRPERWLSRQLREWGSPLVPPLCQAVRNHQCCTSSPARRDFAHGDWQLRSDCLFGGGFWAPIRRGNDLVCVLRPNRARLRAARWPVFNFRCSGVQ